MEKRIVFVGNFKFPEGDAGSNRVLSLAKSLQGAGWQSYFLGTGILRSEDRQVDRYYFQGFEYQTMNTDNSFILLKIINYLKRPQIASDKLRELHNEIPINAIILETAYSSFAVPLIKLAKELRFKVLIDAVEWYDCGHVPFGKYGPVWKDVSKALYRDFINAGNVIAISRLLEEYYWSNGCHVKRIPVTIDTKEFKWKEIPYRSSEHIKIMYAGLVGKKDFIVEILEALVLLGDDMENVEFHLYGPSRKQIMKLLGSRSNILEKLNDTLYIHGRVSHSQVVDALKCSDYTILIRPDQKYANAGFPTKVVESLAVGTPVILNYTSDLKEYITDGVEGIVSVGYHPQSIADAIRRATSLSAQQRVTMRTNARKRALESFDYRIFINDLKEYMEGLQDPK